MEVKKPRESEDEGYTSSASTDLHGHSYIETEQIRT